MKNRFYVPLLLFAASALTTHTGYAGLFNNKRKNNFKAQTAPTLHVNIILTSEIWKDRKIVNTFIKNKGGQGMSRQRFAKKLSQKVKKEKKLEQRLIAARDEQQAKQMLAKNSWRSGTDINNRITKARSATGARAMRVRSLDAQKNVENQVLDLPIFESTSIDFEGKAERLAKIIAEHGLTGKTVSVMTHGLGLSLLAKAAGHLTNDANIAKLCFFGESQDDLTHELAILQQESGGSSSGQSTPFSHGVGSIENIFVNEPTGPMQTTQYGAIGGEGGAQAIATPINNISLAEQTREKYCCTAACWKDSQPTVMTTIKVTAKVLAAVLIAVI